MRNVAWLVLGLLLAGCSSTTFPDPNQPVALKDDPARVLGNIGAVAAMLDRRIRDGQLAPEQRDELLKQYVGRYQEVIDPKAVPPGQAWQYGDIYRSAKDWKTARDLYAKAVEAAKNEDRRVNDHLRLAQAEAQLGNVQRAIELARATFSAPGADKAPILPAVLFEVLPAGLGKGKDPELAKLLEDAIGQHKQVIVDPKSDAGQRFMAARTALMRQAWIRAVNLYQASAGQDAARQAFRRFETAMSAYATV